jgi:hypothetical protein
MELLMRILLAFACCTVLSGCGRDTQTPERALRGHWRMENSSGEVYFDGKTMTTVTGGAVGLTMRNEYTVSLTTKQPFGLVLDGPALFTQGLTFSDDRTQVLDATDKHVRYTYIDAKTAP